MKKIVLGTAQFGMDYGINNKEGEIPQAEAIEILHKAIDYGIDIFDTAYTYGKSEKILGNFMKSCQDKVKIISKLPRCRYNEVKKLLEHSLKRLNLFAIYGYLIHSFKNYKEDPKIWTELERLKNDGKIEKIGFSIYSPSELESLLKDGLKIDMVQVPFSIFDQRFKPYFSELKKRRMEIYVRSVFLQGLVFKRPAELDNYFEPIKNKIEWLNLLSKKSGVPIFALCLNFVVRIEFVDKVVVGVDNIQHLNEIMQASNYFTKLDNIIPQLSDLRVDDEKIILPFNWNMHKIAA